MPYCTRSDLQASNIESSVIEINRKKARKLFVFTVYKAPDKKLELFLEGLSNMLRIVPSESDIIILGDFNVNVLATKKDPLRQQLIRFGNLHYLEQLIKTPTRITEKSATAIDLLFVNNYHHIIDSGVLDPSLSDHSLIYCIAKAGVPTLPPRTIEYRSYRNYSQSAFVNDLKNVDWNIIDIQESVNDAVELWEKLFTDIADRHAPTRKLRVKGRHAPWITANLSNAMRDRDYHKRKAIKSNSEYHWKLYKQAKNKEM